MECKEANLLGEYGSCLVELFSRDRSIDGWVAYQHSINRATMAPRGHLNLGSISVVCKAAYQPPFLHLQCQRDGEIEIGVIMGLERTDAGDLRVGLPTVTSLKEGLPLEEVLSGFFHGITAFHEGAVIISKAMDSSFTVETIGVKP